MIQYQQYHMNVSTDPNAPSYLRRISAWERRRQLRHLSARAQKSQGEMAECTFAPCLAAARWEYESPEVLERLKQPSALYADNKAWGFDAYVARQQEARERRREQLEYERKVLNQTNRSGDTFQRARVTEPQPFLLGKDRPVASYARSAGTGAVEARKQHMHPRARWEHKMAVECRAELEREVGPSMIEPPSVPPGLFSAPCSGTILQQSLGYLHHS